MKKIVSVILLLVLNCCSFANKKTVPLSINSNPSGADLYIDGSYYGKTPITINIEPKKDYSATLMKQGYGKSNLTLETWYSIRENRGGADQTRCALDALGVMLIVPAFGFYSSHCRDFKIPNYQVNIQPNSEMSNQEYSNYPLNNRGGFSQ
jgi:hypothetical protein